MTDPTNGDARPKTRAQERADAIQTPTRTELLERATAAERNLEAATQRADENLKNWQRTAADFANYRRRVEEERATAGEFATAVLLARVLAVLDDFHRALDNVPEDAHESWVEGVRLVERKLLGLLEAEGMTPIEAIGQPFDPNVHEAVAHDETTEYPDNQVIGEVQRGYRLHDRVLRPALVRVANNSNR